MGEIIGYLLLPALFSMPAARLIKFISIKCFSHEVSYKNSYWASFWSSGATLLFLNIFYSITLKYKDEILALPMSEKAIDLTLYVFSLVIPTLIFHFIAFKIFPDVNSHKLTTRKALLLSIILNSVYFASIFIIMSAVMYLFIK